MTVAVLRDGTRESALRLREKDSPTEVLTGAGPGAGPGGGAVGDVRGVTARRSRPPLRGWCRSCRADRRRRVSARGAASAGRPVSPRADVLQRAHRVVDGRSP